MYTDELIGQWVKRLGRKRHKVESVINGELVANCGRRLRVEGYEAVMPPEAYRVVLYCSQCLP